MTLPLHFKVNVRAYGSLGFWWVTFESVRGCLNFTTSTVYSVQNKIFDTERVVTDTSDVLSQCRRTFTTTLFFLVGSQEVGTFIEVSTSTLFTKVCFLLILRNSDHPYVILFTISCKKSNFFWCSPLLCLEGLGLVQGLISCSLYKSQTLTCFF